MNIFILDNDLQKSVEYHIDAHVIKMPLEAAQMISTAVAIDNHLGFIPRALTRAETTHLKSANYQGWPFYKPSYINHPCSIWARQSNTNFKYLVDYCLFLNKEKLHRWPSNPSHKSAELIEDFIHGWWPVHLASNTGFTPFAQAMPEDYKTFDAVDAYRTYYFCEKQSNKSGKPMAIWTNRDIPQWWKEVL